PRFFGFVIGGSLPAALAANWLAGAWDQNSAFYDVTPGTAFLEELALTWLIKIFKLPAKSGGAFVTGATLANFSALAAARHATLTRAGWNVESDALPLLSSNSIICAQAGNVNTGAFDPIQEICRRAHDVGAWVHVDGAFGLWASAAPTRSYLTKGVEEADSWATDAHKWLNVPYDSGLAFVRD